MNLFLSARPGREAVARACAEALAQKCQCQVLRPTARTWRVTVGALGVSEAVPAELDWALLPEWYDWSSFGVLACDMDSTLITIECIDELADFYHKKAEVAAITEAAMRGEITDFADSLRRRVALLEGLEESALEAVYRDRLRLSEGAAALIAAARSHGLSTLLVSGGFTFFTERLKHRLQLDAAHANCLEIEHGRLTGRVLPPILDSLAKCELLKRHCDNLGVPLGRAIAIGDGANDVPMLLSAGLSVAYHAKAAVAQAAQVAIRHGGLDLLIDWLKPQGEARPG